MPNGRTTIWRWVFVIGAIFLVGCREQERPQPKAVPICLQNIDKAVLMDVAEDVLARLHFDIEKADAEHGIIRTRPLAGAQFFEMWRHDNVGSFNAAEANLTTIRRTVELNLTQQNRGLCIACDVRTERLNLPEQEITSSGRAYFLFSRSGASMQKIKLNKEQEAGVSWIDLGPDSKLAADILTRIQEQIASQPRLSASGVGGPSASARPRR